MVYILIKCNSLIIQIKSLTVTQSRLTMVPCNIAVSMFFVGLIPVVMTFPMERPVFLREYSTRTYGVLPYFLSKQAVELPMNLLTCVIVWLINYWICGFQGNFICLVFSCWALMISTGSFAYLLSSMCSTLKEVQELCSVFLTPQFMFAGYFISISQIPIALRRFQYIAVLKYAINLLSVAELGGELCDDIHRPQCKAVLKKNEIEEDDFALYIYILLGLFLGLRLLSLVILSLRGRY